MVTAGAGITIVNDVISNNLADNREIWLHDLYASPSATDSDTIAAFVSAFNAGTYGNCVLRFANGKGHGPQGRYQLDREFLFTAPYRLGLDFCDHAGVDYNTSAAKWRFKPPASNSAQFLGYPFNFAKGGDHKFAAQVDCIFFFDAPYFSSRPVRSGYLEDVRVTPKDVNNAAHTLNTMVRTSNTWFFDMFRCDHVGHPTSPGAYTPGSSMLEQ